jgi:Ser/Thr protein kinase RdoA (MazF antagonist)
MDLIRVARSEKACPCCGETMRMHHDSDEMFAVVVINEWLGRQYPRREADGETQRAIADMLSWSLASAQTQCCGNSLGRAQRSIAELCGWLGMTWAQLEAAAQRWSFELDDPMKAHRVRRQPSGWRALTQRPRCPPGASTASSRTPLIFPQ